MKKELFIYNFIIFLIAAICGCGGQTKYASVENGVIEFDLAEALENEAVSIDDLIDSIKIIPLETSNESLLSFI